MHRAAAVKRVATVIMRLPLRPEIRERGAYGHIGATLADSVLQAGLNYRTVVLPRVRRILQEYPFATTTSTFFELVRQLGALTVLCWSHAEKPARLERLLELLEVEAVETEAELALFMDFESNCRKLLSVHGVGLKTVDYMKMLLGRPTVAVDRHIRRLFEIAAVPNEDYHFVREVLLDSADLLGIRADALDAAIWDYFSAKNAVFSSETAHPLAAD